LRLCGSLRLCEKLKLADKTQKPLRADPTPYIPTQPLGLDYRSEAQYRGLSAVERNNAHN